MASNLPQAAAPPDDESNNGGTAKWIVVEVKGMLHTLNDKKDTHMSGNGFKPQVWASVINKLNEVNPDANPKKDKQKCVSKLNYLKKIFDEYLFVQKYSGTGWDDTAKHATNTAEYVEDFAKTHGKKYAKCFKDPCPYYTELDTLYSGLINKATGENVVHLVKRKSRSKKSIQTSTAAVPGASTSAATRAPLEPVSVNAASSSANNDASPTEGPSGESMFDDELDIATSISPPVSKKRERAQMDDDGSDTENVGKRPLKRHRSESGGTARRNAEAGTQISRALDNLSNVMAQPLVTAEDLSHVADVVEILKDTTLLPSDPRGRLYRTVTTALSRAAALARVFILEQDRTRRIGLLEGILEDAGLLDL
ncbi:hypothetical protein B0H17DRAFT_1216272 [Mycena rosella]|uniref:Myb/SANT-like domain-containing protein n=1 Tax=Mycena rosella TaxID=1033263 RepID=A0AAD7FWF8_MYCRO|nr:hypothetical protein B0H17DRAFT_1216272 [Mycena rosella]